MNNKIIFLNLNLSAINIINLKKNLYNIKFLKKIKYKNLILYGNFSQLNIEEINFTHKNLIPILYIYNKKNISILKYKQLQQKINIDFYIKNFFNTFK